MQITAKGDSGTIKPHLNCSSLISVASLALLISQCNNKHLMTSAKGNSYFVSRESPDWDSRETKLNKLFP